LVSLLALLGLGCAVLAAPPPDDVKKKEERLKVARALDGKPAPAFKADFALNTKVVGLAELKGKVVILEFWALWCPYCVQSFKHTNDLYAKYKDKGVELLGVTTYFENYALDKKTGKLTALPQKMTPAQERAAIKDFAAYYKMEHPILFLPDKEYVRVSEGYGRGGVPAVYVIDKQGNVRFVQAGISDDTAKVIGQVVDKLLTNDGGKTGEGRTSEVAAIRVDTAGWKTFTARGNAFLVELEYDKAMKEYDKALSLNPKHAGSHYNRAVVQMLAGRPEAMASFQLVIALDGYKGSLGPYAVILGTLAARRAKDEPGAERILKEAADKINPGWPQPVVKFLRGDIDEAALLKAATDDGKRTEAHCYLGLDDAQKDRRAEALAHFKWIQAHPAKDFSEYTIALAELKRLERTPMGSKR
jgi:peroxiredoxin